MGNRGSFDSLRSIRMTFFGREGQGQRGDAVGGVQVAEFAGHSSGCAVYLIHARGSRAGARQIIGGRIRRAFFTKERMLSQAECERPVTVGTSGEWGQGVNFRTR